MLSKLFGGRQPRSFGPEVRQALAAARDAALEMRNDYIGPEHLLLGLLRDPDGPAPRLLRALDVDPRAIGEEVRTSTRSGTGPPRPGELPYTARAKRSLELSLREMRIRLGREVDALDLLTALAAEERGLAAKVLNAHGLTLRRLREARDTDAGEPPHFEIVLDDASDRPIYEQIVQRVKEGVAVGTLRPEHRLPSVRGLADELEIAPGTVARAYGELEAAGVVITEGARGTRVSPQAPSGRERSARSQALVDRLRPVAVAGYHLGATRSEMKEAFALAMRGIFEEE